MYTVSGCSRTTSPLTSSSRPARSWKYVRMGPIVPRRSAKTKGPRVGALGAVRSEAPRSGVRHHDDVTENEADHEGDEETGDDQPAPEQRGEVARDNRSGRPAQEREEHREHHDLEHDGVAVRPLDLLVPFPRRLAEEIEEQRDRGHARGRAGGEEESAHESRLPPEGQGGGGEQDAGIGRDEEARD